MTFKPSFKFMALSQRVADGDIYALPDLWPLMFDTPFDATRPAEDICNDVAARMTELFSPAPPKEPTPAEKIEKLNEDILALVEELVSGLFDSLRKAMRK